MRLKLFRHGISIFALLIFFAAVSVAAVSLLNRLVMNQVEDEMTQQLYEGCVTDLNHLSTTLAEDLSDLRLQNFENLLNADVRYLAVYDLDPKSYESASHIAQVRDMLRTRMTHTPLIAESYILFPSSSRKVNSQSGYTISEEAMAQLLQIPANAPDGIYETGSGIGFWNCWPRTMDVAPHSITRIAYTEVSTKELNALLAASQGTREDYHFLLVNGETLIAGESEAAWAIPELVQAEEAPYINLTHEDEEYLCMWKKLGVGELYLGAVIGKDIILSELQAVKERINLLRIALIGIFLLMALIMMSVIYRPVRRMEKAMKQVGTGRLDVRLPRAWSSEFNVLSDSFNKMAESLNTHIQQEYEYKLLMQEAEMKQLQYQINPHFLYNTYFQLRNLIYIEDLDNANRLAKMLGEHLRYVAQIREGDTTLAQELAHAKSYAMIQEMRFAPRIRVEFDIDDCDWSTVHLPYLLLQPLIENAFDHGVKDKAENGLVKMTCRREGQELHIFVDDNGNGLTDAQVEELRAFVLGNAESEKRSVALRNIHKRLMNWSGGKSGLLIERSPLGGLHVGFILKEDV